MQIVKGSDILALGEAMASLKQFADGSHPAMVASKVKSAHHRGIRAGALMASGFWLIVYAAIVYFR